MYEKESGSILTQPFGGIKSQGLQIREGTYDAMQLPREESGLPDAYEHKLATTR